MRHYIVLLDKLRIPGEARVPDFEHVWAEYPETQPADCSDHLWRANIGVTHSVPIPAAVIDGCAKLQRIFVLGADAGIVDAPACAVRGIDIIHLPAVGLADPMAPLMDAIEAFVAALPA